MWIRENPRTTWLERMELRLPGVYARLQKQLWDGYSVADRWRIKPGPQREAMQSEFKKFLEIVRDPELRRKLTPDYHLGCTRIPKSDRNYYEAVQQPNVQNLFMLYGPFAPVNNLSVPIGLLQEIEYIMKIVEIGRQRNAAVMPTVAATEKFLERMRAALPDTVWVGCKNWYSDQTGTPILWPPTQDDHTDMMADIALGDLEFVPVGQPR